MEDDLIMRQQVEIETLNERIRQLEEVLAPPSVPVPIEWGLTGAEARVFAHLTTREVATKQSIMTALYSDRPDDDPQMKIIDVFICKMRRKLKPHSIAITTVWGQGYSLENYERYRGEAT